MHMWGQPQYTYVRVPSRRTSLVYTPRFSRQGNYCGGREHSGMQMLWTRTKVEGFQVLTQPWDDRDRLKRRVIAGNHRRGEIQEVSRSNSENSREDCFRDISQHRRQVALASVAIASNHISVCTHAEKRCLPSLLSQPRFAQHHLLRGMGVQSCL